MLRIVLILGFCLLITSCASSQISDELYANPQMAAQHPRDDYQTGMRYLLGKSAPQDYSKALAYFMKAAEKGNPYAENELGFLYTTGKGVPQDYVTALQWYKKAAQHGLASAQYNLGLLYLHGLGTPVNKVEAHKWLQQAADRGFNPARQALTSI